MIGDAADGATAIRVVEELQPEVVLMDLRMPGMGGLEAMTHIRTQWPKIAVVILTTFDEDEPVLRGLQEGAAGYLLKDMSSDIIFQIIRAAARGEMAC